MSSYTVLEAVSNLYFSSSGKFLTQREEIFEFAAERQEGKKKEMREVASTGWLVWYSVRIEVVLLSTRSTSSAGCWLSP